MANDPLPGNRSLTMNNTLAPTAATDSAIDEIPLNEARSVSRSAEAPSVSAGRTTRELIALFVVAIGPFLPLLVDLLIGLWERPHYQFFPMVLIAAVVLTRLRLRTFAPWQPGYSQTGLVIMGLAYLGLAFATVTTSPWTGYVSLLIMLAGVLHCLGGWALVRRLAGVGILLITLLPPPFNGDHTLIVNLQAFATKQANRVLDLLAVPHLLEGNTIIVPDRSLFVEEACSGIHSLTSVLVISLIYVVWRERHWLHSLLVVGLSVVWVLAANVIRIVVIAYAQVEQGTDLSTGTPHQILGIILFLACAGLVLSSDCLMCLFRPTRKKTSLLKQPRVARNRRLSIALPWRALAASIAIVCFGLTAFRVTVLAIAKNREAYATLTIADSLMPLQHQSFRRQPDSMTQSKRNSRFSSGDNSNTWRYQSGNWISQVSVDYPFPGGHPLEVCYIGNGWQMRNLAVVDSERGKYRVVDLTHPERGTGRLLYALVGDDGRYVEFNEESVTTLLDRPARMFDIPKAPTPKYQIQVLLEGRGNPPPALVKESEGMFFVAVERFMENLPRMKGAQP